MIARPSKTRASGHPRRVVNRNSPIQTGAQPTNEGNDETTKAALFAEQAFHPGRVNFPAREVAEILRASVSHISNLIKCAEIIVPQENIDRAASRASIIIPRESLIDFLRRRTKFGPSKRERERKKKK
jgi:hypothetical protein